MTDNTVPRAYINYMLFDEQMHLVGDQSGAVQVTSASADRWSVIGTASPINVTHNGFLLVYLSAEQIRDIFFDDFHVVHKKGRLLEENHYYPHGLTIRAGSANPVPTREGYQGKELQDELGLELYDFHARQYDPQIGRFWGVDPADQFPSGYTGMGNNPGNMIDPTGMMSFGAAANGSRSAGGMRRRDSDFEPYFASYHMEWEELTEIQYGGSGSSADQPQQGEEAPTTELYNGTTGKAVGKINDNLPNALTIVDYPTNISDAELISNVKFINSLSPEARDLFAKYIRLDGHNFDVESIIKFFDMYSKEKVATSIECVPIYPKTTFKLDGVPITPYAEYAGLLESDGNIQRWKGNAKTDGDAQKVYPYGDNGNGALHLHTFPHAGALTTYTHFNRNAPYWFRPIRNA